MIKVQAHQIAVGSDLRQYGRRFDDGAPIIGEQFFVQYEDDQGRRWRHCVYFDSLKPIAPSSDEDLGEGPYFENVLICARQRAEKLAIRIRQAGTVNLNYWWEERPAYGSQAWITGGQELEEIARERMEAENEH